VNRFAKPTPDIKCLECGAEGIIDGSDFCKFSVLANSDESTMTFTCKRCGKPIIVLRDQVAVSPDPLFQTIGILGTSNGMIQPIDNDACGRITINYSDGHKTIIDSGTAKMQFRDPKTGRLLFETTMEIGKEPEFLLSPGIYREYPLPEPVDKIFAISLRAIVAPELEDKVELWLRPVQDGDGRYSSIRTAVATSSPDVLPENRVNVICHLFAVREMSQYALWLRQMFEAIEQTNEGNFETALLDYARACEIFIGDYLRRTLRQVYNFDDALAKQVAGTQADERVARILPLLTVDPRAYDDAKKAWRKNVKDVRDKKVAHVPVTIEKEECWKAHDSAYWFIRALQSQCKFEAGKKWDYWARPTENGEPENRRGSKRRSA
jgi:hypothetical protein